MLLQLVFWVPIWSCQADATVGDLQGKSEGGHLLTFLSYQAQSQEDVKFSSEAVIHVLFQNPGREDGLKQRQQLSPEPSHQHDGVVMMVIMSVQFQLCDFQISVTIMYSRSSVFLGYSQRLGLPWWFISLMSGSPSRKPRLEFTSPGLSMICKHPIYCIKSLPTYNVSASCYEPWLTL